MHRLFSGGAGARDDRPAPATAESAANEILNSDAVSALLANLHKTGLDPNAGKIQMIDLEEARRALGPRWAKRAARAMEIAESVLHARLEHNDLFVRYEDRAFIVVFADRSEAAARLRAEAISHEICRMLMRNPELGRAIRFAASVGGLKRLIGRLGKPTLGDLSRALDRQLTRRRKRPRVKARGENAAAIYRPMLYVPQQTIGIYVGIPRGRSPDGELLIGAAAYAQGRARDRRGIDLTLSRAVIGDLRRSVASGNRSFVGTMAHFDSLDGSRRLLRLFRNLSEDERNHLVLEIAGVPPELPVKRLHEVVGRYRPLVKAVNLRTRLLDPHPEDFASVGWNSIGCDLNADDASRLESHEVPAAMERFVKLIGARDARAHFYGIDTPALLRTAVDLGAYYLTGEAVAGFVDAPAAPRILDIPETPGSAMAS